MRNLLFLFFAGILYLFNSNSYAQAPEKFNYQAVLRNSSGELISDQSVDVEISIRDIQSDGTILYTETHTKTINSFGLVNLVIGSETPDLGVFSEIIWAVNDKFIQVKVDAGSGLTDMGTFQLLSVPFAMHAASASNLGSENVYTGTDTLFVVKDTEGNPVFVVFPDGAKVIVEEATKGTVGGFAVSGRSPTKAEETEIFRVTPDSTRIFVNDTIQGKGRVGGFAVSGRSPTKGITSEYLVVTQDSTRVYISDTTLTKGRVGGFAVSGRSPTKNESVKFMDMTKENYFIGHESGSNLSTGAFNSTLGYQSGLSIEEGNENAFIGYQSGYNNSTGSGNLFLGYQTGFSNEFGNYNSFLGYLAGYSNTTGVYNTFLGSFSGYSNTEGNNNTFVGDSTGFNNVSGIENTFLGTGCGKNNNSGTSNVFIGNKSGFSNTSGYTNVFIGNRAGFLAEDGVHNVFIGDSSGYNSSKTWGNVNIGFLSGFNTTTGSANTYLGSKTGYRTTTGFSNTFIGIEAGYSLDTNCCNTFIGDHAGHFVTNGERNVFIGAYTGYNESKSETGSFANIMIGNQAGFNSTGGGTNIFLGFKSGYNNVESHGNIFLGYLSGFSHQSGNENFFIGSTSGFSNTTGWANIFIGPRSGLNNINGDKNIFIGHQAGMNELGSSKLYIDNWEADSSHAFIFGDLDNNILRFNAKVGIAGNADEAYDLTINPEWGPAAIKLIGSSDGIIYSTIGLVSKGTPIENSWHIEHSIDKHKFKLKNFDGSGWYVNLELDTLGNMIVNRGGINVGGNIIPILSGFDLGTPTEVWQNIYTLNAVTVTSDARLKSNILNLGYGLNEIMKLRSVTFNWKNDQTNEKKIGLIAQEVDEVIHEVVNKGEDELQTLGINYSDLIPVLINGMQDQQQIIETQKSKISELENRLNKIEKLLMGE
ncbi:MAG: tail fiber domain-containing protein [Bacteroidales bacterium]|nr:tail fiber domain-containing protein [Bacteroidales bacterium]